MACLFSFLVSCAFFSSSPLASTLQATWNLSVYVWTRGHARYHRSIRARRPEPSCPCLLEGNNSTVLFSRASSLRVHQSHWIFLRFSALGNLLPATNVRSLARGTSLHRPLTGISVYPLDTREHAHGCRRRMAKERQIRSPSAQISISRLRIFTRSCDISRQARDMQKRIKHRNYFLQGLVDETIFHSKAIFYIILVRKSRNLHKCRQSMNVQSWESCKIYRCSRRYCEKRIGTLWLEMIVTLKWKREMGKLKRYFTNKMKYLHRRYASLKSLINKNK